MTLQTVTLPRELVDRVSDALATAVDMMVAIDYLACQDAQDEVMAGSLCAVKACVEKLERAIGDLPSDFPKAVEAAQN